MATAKNKRKRRAADKARRHAGTAPVEFADPAARKSGSPPPSRYRRRPEPEGIPPAPWGSFPLVELMVLIGIFLLVLGFTVAEGERRGLMIAVGIGLASLAGVELAFREHFAGYRSHTTLLAAIPATIAVGLLFFFADELALLIRVAIGAFVFVAAAWQLTRVFRARSGGFSFRFVKPT